MKNLVLAILFLTACANAQQRNTVYQQLFDGPITTAPETSSTFYAIGQTQHKVTIQLMDRPAQTCVGGFVDIFLEGSGTGAIGTYTTIGNPISNISANQYGQLVTTVIADIAMPYVRLVVNSFDTTNCSLTALYSGTISPTDDPVPPLFYPLQVVQAGVPLDLVPTTNVVDATEFNTHRIYYDLTDCDAGAGDIWEIGIQLQYSFATDGPWLPLGYYGFTSSVQQGLDILASGNFPLVRGWMVDTGTTGCDATVYYWGSTNETSLVDSIITGARPQSQALTGGGLLTATIVPIDTGALFDVVGVTIQNPCAAGQVRLQPITAVGPFIQVGPNSTVTLDLNGKYFQTDVDDGLEFNADGSLTASCTANVNIWYTQINPVYP